MDKDKVSSLKDGHAQVRGDITNSTPTSSVQKKIKRRTQKSLLERLFSKEIAEKLKDTPTKTIRDAWVIGAHLLLDDGAHVIDMGCEKGEMAYAMSLMYPQWKFTGIDSDTKSIEYAKVHYKTKNLTFLKENISSPRLKENSVDAIINSFVLHEVYSKAKFNTRRVRETLELHHKALKTDGYMFVRDYTTPGPGDFILMEMKNEPSTGDGLADLSEADLLVWFSDNVRSGDSLKTGGFYLEELPPRFPNTRLFRLPHKWAYEYILRKDDRALLEEDLNTEYTFATHRDLRRDFRAMGARLLYCTSNWDDDFIKKNMVGHFKLYKENGTPLGYPETSYTMLVQKIEKQDSIRYQEWRTSRNKAKTLRIESLRNDHTGVITDIISRDLDLTEILPFYETNEGRVRIFLQDEVPRSIANTVPRQGHNITGQGWSGHMIEALPFHSQDILEIENSKTKKVSQFIKEQLDLKTNPNESFAYGTCTYADPKSIDERTDSRYIRVHAEQDPKPLEQTKYIPPEGERFNTIGRYKDYDAQSILDAISVGLIPNAKLEAQIFKLFYLLKKMPKKWSDCPLVLSEMDVKERMNVKDILLDETEEKKRFSPVKTPAGNLRVVHSVFMEEGQDEMGSMTDISSREQDFFIQEEDSQNVAVVLPLVKNMNGEVMMGLIKEHAPVPERYSNNGTIVNVPSFPLPNHIEDMESAKKYVAKAFKVDPKFVGHLGEPYFQHIGITPKKMYPFAVTNLKGKQDYEHFSLTSYAPLSAIWPITGDKYTKGSPIDLLKTMAEAHMFLGQDHDLAVTYGFDRDLYAEHTSGGIAKNYNSGFLMNSEPSTPPPTKTNPKKPQVA